MRAAIVIGNRGDVNPGLPAAPAGAIELVGADIDERGGVAVIGMIEDDEVFAAGVRARKAESEFVGFAAGIHEVANFERSGKERGESFGVAKDVVMEIARVGVEES